MNILPDVSYNVQGTALPFEHLLTIKILNGSTEHLLLQIAASQIKCKFNISCNYPFFHYSKEEYKEDSFRLRLFLKKKKKKFFFLKWSPKSLQCCWIRDVKNF